MAAHAHSDGGLGVLRILDTTDGEPVHGQIENHSVDNLETSVGFSRVMGKRQHGSFVLGGKQCNPRSV